MVGARCHVVVIVVGLAACGDNRNAAIDAAPDAFEDVMPGCQTTDLLGPDPFADTSKFGKIIPGSLAAADVDGRWFLTGVRLGAPSETYRTSVHFERSGTQLIVDRDATNPGTIDDDQAVHRREGLDDGRPATMSMRVVNALPDGTMRGDYVRCYDTFCSICVVKLVRAGWPDGEQRADKLSLLGEFRGTDWEPGVTVNVRVLGSTAYLVRADGLHIIDITDLAQPVEVGKWRRTGMGLANDVKVFETGGKRYVLIADTPVDVIDVTNGAAPVQVSTLPETAHTVAIEVRGGVHYAYTANYDGSAAIYDVTDPTTPVRLGRFSSTGAHDLSVVDGIVYLSALDAGFLVVDFTNPAAPMLIGKYKPNPILSHSNWTTIVNGRRIALHGEEGHGAHLDVIELDPASPNLMKPIGTYRGRSHVSIHNLMAFGTKGYASHYHDGVRVFDLADPTQPKLLGYYNTWDANSPDVGSGMFEGAWGIDVDPARQLIFVADTPRGLLILRDGT